MRKAYGFPLILCGLLAVPALWPLPSAAQLTNEAMRPVLQELKMDSSILDGLSAELAVPKTWIDGARGEGVVRITTITQEEYFVKIWKVFSTRYPGIEVEYTRGVGQRRALQPLLAFRQGRYITDVASSFQVLDEEYRKADALMEVASILPAAKSVDPKFSSKHGVGIAYRLTNFCMAYNTRKLKASDMPRTWEDFLTDPRYRNGAVGMATNANTWIAELWGYKGEAWAKDYVRRIFTDLRPQLRKEGLVAIGSLAGIGEFDIAIPISDAATNNHREKGLPIAFHCPDIVPVAIQWIGVMKGNPHLNASLLFTNWAVSREGQLAFHWADSMTPANSHLQGKEFYPFPEQIVGKPKAPLAGVALTEMPTIMKYWREHWDKSGGAKGGKAR